LTYLPGIPNAGDRPSQSQGQLLTNFTALNTVFGVDHLAFNAVDGGEHTQVTFNNIIADPGLAAPKASLYTKTVAADSQLFFENFDVGGAVNVIRQMTNLTLNAFVNGGTALGNGQYIDTPWGLRIIWGITAAFSGNRTVICPAGTLSTLAAQATAHDAGSPTNGIVGTGATTLTIGNPNVVSVNYLMLGRY